MRKTTFALGLGLALSLGAGTLHAQRPDAPRSGDRGPRAGEQMRGGRGGAARLERLSRGHGALLRGITLTDAQRTQVQALRTQQRTARQVDQAETQQRFEGARVARKSGDTVALRKLHEQRQAEFAKEREQEIAAIRRILTAEQRVTFDRNVAELKARQEQRAASARGGRGPGHGPGTGQGRGHGKGEGKVAPRGR